MTEHAWLEHAAAYALGALDEQDRISFEAHLATCDVCTAEVRQLREVAGLLATAAASSAPPPGLRDRILAEARRVRPIATANAPAVGQLSGSTPAPDARAGTVITSSSGRSTILPWFAAAAAAVVAVIIGLQYRGERDARVAAQQSLESARLAMDSASQVLRGRDSLIASLVSPDVEAVSVSGTGPQPSAKYFFDRRAGRIVIAANALPPAAQGRTYQLWGIETGRAPVSLGTFNSDPSGRALATLMVPIGLRVAVTAVTDEPAGGSPQPTTTPFLAATWKAD
jgi:anti-sigma-K factor RskA